MRKIRQALANRYAKVAGAVAVATALAVSHASVTPVYSFTGTEFDQNKAGLTAVLGLAALVIAAFVGIRLLRRGGSQVR